MASGERVRFAIVGCGLIARAKHLPAFKRMHKEAQVVALCDRELGLAMRTADEFGVPRAYSSATEMLNEQSPDAVDLCVPPQVHAPIAIEALEHGCHVLMEKPMALRIDECDEIIEASNRARRTVCVIHNDLFHPPIIEARRIAAAGGIGRVIGMRILLSTPQEEILNRADHWYHRLPGGMLGETGPHVAYLAAAFISNIRSASVLARNITNRPWAPFDDFRIELEGDNGTCTATVLYAQNNRSALIDIYGTEGTLQVDLERMLMHKDDLREMTYSAVGVASLQTLGETLRGLVANAGAVALGRSRVGTDLIIEGFVQSVLRGGPPPVSIQEGREAVRIESLIVDELGRKYPESVKLRSGEDSLTRSPRA